MVFPILFLTNRTKGDIVFNMILLEIILFLVAMAAAAIILPILWGILAFIFWTGLMLVLALWEGIKRFLFGTK